MHSKTLLLLVFLKQLSAFFTGFHLGDYPPADFSKTVKLSSQNNSFVEIEHFLGKIPFHVHVYATASNGNNKGFKFDGTGVCQNDGRDNNAYGGVIFAYDKHTIRVWTPTRMSGSKVGSVIFVGERWGGNKFSQDSLDAEVTIEAWEDGPVPSYQIETEVDAGLEKNTNIIYHDLHQIPEIVSVRIFSGVDSENSYIFHASGVIQTSNIREYGGVIFSYNEKKVVLWTPNKPKTGCTLVNKRWGNGKYYKEMFSKTCKVHIRMWINSFPPPVFQTPWKPVYAGRTTEPFLEIKHNLKMVPSYVKLQYRSVGQPYSLVFEGVGSVQSTTMSNSRHGGLVFAYDKVSVRIWLPTNVNKHQSYIIFVGDGWGNSDENVTEIMAEFRVQIFLNRCFEAEKIVDSQGYCRDVSEIAIIQDMSAWSKCSNPCGEGLKQRFVTGCHGQSLQNIMNCQFNVDFCGFSNISWIRSMGSKEINIENKHLQIPFYGVKHGSYFVYSSEGVLTSPELKDAKGCILLFKYSTGKYYGNLQIDILSNLDLWRENVWSMKYDESFGSNVWLTGYLNIGDLLYELKRFRFVHNPTKNFISDPISLTDIILKCEKPDEFKMTAEACKEKEEMLASCLVDVFKPFSRGPAWSVSIPKNDLNQELGTYVTSNGMYNDLIAKYKFQIMKSGSYQLWLESFAMNNDSNSVIVQIYEDLTVADTIYNMRHGLWLPIIKEFHFRPGSYVIVLRQKDKYFSFKNMMLAPKEISVWSELGMQSHHIPDSNFYSLNYPDDYLVYSRLNGRAGWMPTDRTTDRMYLEIRLPDIALINKIATQGGTWLDTAHPAFYCKIEDYKIKFSLDGQNFAFYRNLTSKEIFKLEGNNNVSHLVVEHFFDYVLVAKSIRIYPSTITIHLCLRAELYGYYITKGICPIIKSKAKEEVCLGDGQCENSKARCQIDPVNNQSVCLCKEGYHGNLCQFYGCSPNPCKNDGVCVQNSKSIFCNCTPGFHGRYCQVVCPKGKYGRNCVFSCECAEKNYCNPVNGSCLCEPGYHGNDCNKKCPENTYGQDCIFKCLCNKFMECDHVTGECLCKEGWKGIECSSPCENGTFGRNCSQKCKCLNGGICNQTNGFCDCTPGYYGQQCEHICDSNRWGDNCKEYCETIKNSTCDHITGHYTCFSGLMGTFCNVECPDGKFGENCMHSCACDMKNTEKCDKQTGHCVCKLGYRGARCDKLCENSWGSQCHNLCNCKNAVSCNPFTGECICMDGFIGKQCEQECKEGYYGRNCSMKCICEKKNTEKCKTNNGFCKCQPGYTGGSCTETCREGYWGINCLEQCLCFNNSKCDHRDGFCYCAPGFQGQYCTEHCEHGTFGENCQQKCHCKNDADCDNVDGHCICAPGFAGKFCEFKCPKGKYGENCLSNCNCRVFNTEDCDNVNGFCFCQNGFVGTRCEKECDDGFYGKRCQSTCPVCFHSSSNICNKRFGNCSCADGFTGWYCLSDCDWSHFGHMCKQQCNCKPNELCNNINGQCYDSNLHLVTIKLRASSQLFLEDKLRQEIQRKFEIMMLHCFERLEGLLLKSPALNISDLPSCSMVGGEQMFDSDNLEHSSIYVMRIYNVFAMYVENEEIAALVFTLLRGADPVNATFILDVISFIGINAFSAGLNYEYYVGEASFDKQRENWYSNTMYLAIAISCVCTVLLLFVGFVVFCRRKNQSPFEKVRRESKDIELKSCIGNSKGHVYSFENPYYDVIAAMGLDDDIEEDYYNPLYMLDLQPDSDNEVDDMYYECQNNEYKSFLYDKDSGVSSVTLS